MPKIFEPSKLTVKRYADVLVNFALNSGAGIKPNEVVECVVPDVAKPLALELQNTILKAGGNPIIRLLPTGFEKDFFSLANKEQLTFFPTKYYKEKSNLIDHQIVVIADVDPRELQSVPPAKMMTARNARKQYRDWLTDKEVKGKFTWTIALWGVPAKAKEVGLSLENYWKQISKACFLDKTDPIDQWKKVFALQKDILAKLNALEIESVHIEGPDADLTIKLGADRVWHGGSGRNIPSFECFTSPDWRGTEGWIKFNQPLYRYGNVLKDIRLEFEKGLVKKAHAKVGNNFLQEMLKTPNANKLGEYSLTDKRMSRITHVMAETLFDENIGGPHGNTHLAVGMAYKDCYRGDASKLTKEDWEAKGFNDSAEHTDIISTVERTVTAKLTNGVEKVIYTKGQFVL
jgi:aminopeptidase